MVYFVSGTYHRDGREAGFNLEVTAKLPFTRLSEIQEVEKQLQRQFKAQWVNVMFYTLLREGD
jgi:hypothetical protein